MKKGKNKQRKMGRKKGKQGKRPGEEAK